MERRLTNEHIEQLFVFTKKHLVEHYDVQVELVDHLANAIEAQWKTNPNISFEEALDKEYNNFGVFGFSGLVEQKQAALQNHYWQIIKKEFINYFTVPRIILSVAFFYGLFWLFSNPNTLLNDILFGLEILLMVAAALFWYFQYRTSRKKHKKWLINSVSNYFYSLPIVMIAFVTFGANRPDRNLFEIILETVFTGVYLLFCLILFTKIIPLLKKEIMLTEQKFQKI